MFKKIIAFAIISVMLMGCNAAPKTSDSSDNAAGTESEKETQSTQMPQMSTPKSGDQVAIMKTSYGDIKIMFYPNEAPKAVENFITHAKNGYFNGMKFHRVIDGFMIQSGSPSGDGMGGESVFGEPFEDEFDTKLHNFRGALSMANPNAPDQNGSQFFIVQANKVDAEMIKEIDELAATGEYGAEDRRSNAIVPLSDIFSKEVLDMYTQVGGTPHLDFKHTVFGQVYEGMDVVDAIATAPVDDSDPNSPVPLEDILINSVEIVAYK